MVDNRSVQYGTIREVGIATKQQQILTAARSLFLHRGFDGTTTDALVEAAGISKETLYRYYASKDELLVAVIHDMAARRHARAADVVLPAGAAMRTLEASLKRLVETGLAEMMRPDYLNLLRLVVAESGRRPKIAALLRDALTGGGALRRLLAQACEQRLVRQDVKVEVAAQMIGGALLLAVFNEGVLAGGRSPDRRAIDVDEIVRLFIRAVAP